MMNDIDSSIKEIANQINNLHEEAYYAYLGPVENLCNNPDASQNEVEHMLDNLLDFCGYDKVLRLFKKVCRTFYEKYPQCIVDYIMIYREEYDPDSLIGQDTDY